jgi:GNAT superfamily N-acetyltransferase
MTPLYKLKDYRETMQFEKEHPKQLRWDEKYKMYMLTQHGQCQGIWLREQKQLTSEVVMSWQSDNVVHLDSFTVLPQYRSQGLGYQIIQLALQWAEQSGYEYMMGEARKGASWHILQSMGATPVLLYKNYNQTGEEYMSFKYEL